VRASGLSRPLGFQSRILLARSGPSGASDQLSLICQSSPFTTAGFSPFGVRLIVQSLVLRWLSHIGSPSFFQIRKDGFLTWLLIGTVVVLVILATGPLLHGRLPSDGGPFAKE
jgi:hypothetical protein